MLQVTLFAFPRVKKAEINKQKLKKVGIFNFVSISYKRR